MPSSTNKGYTQPVYNTEVGTWGDDINNNFSGIVDKNLGGFASISLSNSNYTLSTAESQNLLLKLSGTLLANVIVYTKCVGFFIVENNTSGAYTVTVQSNFGAGGVGSGIIVPQGIRTFITADTTAGARTCPTGATSSLLATSGATPLSVRRTENDTTLRKAISVQSGLGTGNDYSISETGDAASNVVTATESIGSTVVRTVTASAQGLPIPLDLTEISTPSAPSAGVLRVYAKSGDLLAVQTSGGTERIIGASSLESATGLVVTNNGSTPNFKVDITVARASLITSAGSPYFYSGGTVTVDLSVSGAANRLDTGSKTNSTWYHFYLISNGTTTAGLASISATSPTLPSGYTYYMRVGAIQTDGSGNLYKVLIKGNEAAYQIVAAGTYPFVLTGTTGSVWTSQQVTGNTYALPTTAKLIKYTLVNTVSSGVFNSLAPNLNFSTYTGASNPFPMFMAYNNTGLEGRFILESSSVGYFSNSNNSNLFVQLIGWEDSVLAQ